MTLHTAYNFFESLKNQSSKKQEITVYEKFLHILSELKLREFSIDETQSLEKALDSLNLESNPKNRKRFYNKELNKFETYLKDTFSLTSEWSFTIMGLVLGSLFGSLFGVVILSIFDWNFSILLGIGFGLLIGLIIGFNKDYQAKVAGKMF